MSREKRDKLKNLLNSWPRGAVYTTAWLAKQGVRFDLLDRYRRSGWVRSVGNGAVARSGDKIDWTGGLYAVQRQMEKKIHSGGKTSFQLLGMAHFVPLGKNRIISLFGPPGSRLPRWFKNYDWGEKLVYSPTSLFSSGSDIGLIEHVAGDYSILISSPERAMLEVCHQVPGKESFEEARLLMEGLPTLRPDLVQRLLKDCHSFKVKRLFILLGESFSHPWLQRLALNEIDFGRGKRTLVKGGKFDSRLQITVPGEFLDERG